MPNKLHDIVRGLGNAIKLSGRTFLAPHRGSCPKGLHILPLALPPKGEARRYVANDFLNLIALGDWGALYEWFAISTTSHFVVRGIR